MDDPEDPKYTLSFDLLFRGLEVTTGGQRIHQDYDQQVQKMLDRGMYPEEFESYLMIHKHGMPPHGGLGIGLERLTAQLCGLDNVRYASLFPRDLHRMEPSREILGKADEAFGGRRNCVKQRSSVFGKEERRGDHKGNGGLRLHSVPIEIG